MVIEVGVVGVMMVFGMVVVLDVVGVMIGVWFRMLFELGVVEWLLDR